MKVFLEFSKLCQKVSYSRSEGKFNKLYIIKNLDTCYDGDFINSVWCSG